MSVSEYTNLLYVLGEFKKGNKTGLRRLPNIYFTLITNLSPECGEQVRKIVRKLHAESKDVVNGLQVLIRHELAESIKHRRGNKYILTDLGKTFKQYIEEREREFLEHFNLI